MTELARVRTALTDTAAAPLLLAALRVGGVQPSQDQARLLLAQLRFEGLGSCNNHNVGNITTTDTGSRDFFRPAWFDVDPNDPSADPQLVKLHNLMLAGQAPRAFRSYPDFGSGFSDYVHELQTRFPSILSAAATGDAQATANAIKSSGYTPDAPSSLGTTLASIVREFQGRGVYADLPPLAGAAGPPPSPPAPAPPSSSSSPSPPTATVPGVATELAVVRIWLGEDGARGFTLEQGTSMHSGPLAQLLPWLNELGLDGSA